MIQRLRQVAKNLYRGSAPNPQDVVWLKDNLGIRKIVSLDRETGDRITRACKLLGIKQEKVYLDGSRESLLKFLKHDLAKLLLQGGPTYVHCHEGKDRTGLACALVECKYLGADPNRAIQHAKSLGFGIGVDPKIIKLYEKLIRSCKPAKDNNHADIVDNEREYRGDNRDTFLDEQRQDSFAPYLDHTRQNPADAVYVYINDQSPTRENYQQYKSIKEHNKEDTEEGGVPQVGVFNNDAGARGFGPTENYGGFFYD
jgi:protein tyrosine/serine phosphatase